MGWLACYTSRATRAASWRCCLWEQGGEAPQEEEEEGERKQYSLRDRALVTIKPLSQVTGTGGGAAGDR